MQDLRVREDLRVRNLVESDRVTDELAGCLEAAAEISCSLGHVAVGSSALLLGLTFAPDCAAMRILQKLDVSSEKLREALADQLRKVNGGPEYTIAEIPLSLDSKRIFDCAERVAAQLESLKVDTQHVIIGMVKANDTASGLLLSNWGVSASRAIAALHDLESGEEDEEDTAVAQESTEAASGEPSNDPTSGSEVGKVIPPSDLQADQRSGWIELNSVKNHPIVISVRSIEVAFPSNSGGTELYVRGRGWRVRESYEAIRQLLSELPA